MAAQRITTPWQRMLPTLATFVLVILVIACLYWARPVLIPVAVAVLVAFMLGPAVTLLQRRGLRRGVSVVAVVLLAGMLVCGALWLVGSQVVQLLDELPTYQANVARRITEVRERGSSKLLRNVQRFVHEITVAATRPANAEQAATADEADGAVTVRVVERAATSGIAAWAQSIQPVAEPIGTAGLVLVLVVYLLIFREDLRSRILCLVGQGHLTLTTRALDDAGRRISRYLLAQFGLNVAFGVTIGIGLLVIGVPHALLWGFAGGLLRYIPYLGPWIAASLPVGMSLLVSAGWLQPLAVIALFIVVEFCANLVVEPWLYGQSIGVSQAALMVAIIFWTWLWGAVGLMLAAPLTTCLVVMGKYVPGLRFFDVLLGDEPVLTADVTLYQRLLARDEDEASEIVRHQAQSLSPIALCDDVLLPTLVHARRDYQAELLSDEEYEFALTAVESIAEQQDLGPSATDAINADAKTEDAKAAEEPKRPPLSILACAAQNGVEATALDIFRQLLDPRKFTIEVVSAKRLVSEIVALVEQERPAVVCIAALPPGGLSHTRHLCKRLHNRVPEQKIVVARWGVQSNFENRDEWLQCGADYLGTTMNETILQFGEVAQFLRPPSETTTSAVPAPAGKTAFAGTHAAVGARDSAPAASASAPAASAPA